MYKDLHIYIDLNWVSYIDDSSNYFIRFFKIISLAYSHHCTVYVFKEDIESFVQNCQDLDTNFLESEGNKLNLLLENAIVINKDSHVFEINYQNEQSFLLHQDNIFISSVSEKSPISLVSLTQLSNVQRLLFINSSTTFFTFTINIINTHDQIINWISQNGSKRFFNYSPKHGENNLGNWNRASPLHCSRERAQILLNTSIADFSSKKHLFNYDEEYETFIVFYYEGEIPQNQYHGFHISQSEWNSRVPKLILKHFIDV